MFEAFGISAVLNIILLLIVSGSDIASQAAAGVLGIFMPFSETIYWFEFAANLVLSFAAQLLIIKRLEQLWTMLCFFIRTGSRKKLLLAHKKSLYGLLGSIILGKLITDVIYHFVFEAQMDAGWFIYIEISFILAAALWLELIYFVFALGTGSNYAIFISLALTAACLIAARWTNVSLFAYTSVTFSAADIIIKLVLWAVFAASGSALILKRDLLEKGNG